MIWIYERILREVRSRHRTYISKVIQHPSKVMEVQIKKEKCKTRAGQYIFLSCPEVSYFQWHPFTLTSAPEEDYISVHIRVVGDWTNAFAKALGCDFDSKDRPEKGDEGKVVPPPVNRVLPRVMVDGPFGSASEDFLKYETVLLVGAGIGVTPFASILKSIWYRMNGFNQSKPTRLSKVYFTWVIRDFGSAEWFHSLLKAIEDQDSMRRIEISIYLTAKIKDDDATNIMVRFVFLFRIIHSYPGLSEWRSFCSFHTNCFCSCFGVPRCRSKTLVQRKTRSVDYARPRTLAGPIGTAFSRLSQRRHF